MTQISSVKEAVEVALFWEELRKVLAQTEEALAQYMAQTGRTSLVAGDVSVEVKDPGKTYDHQKAAEAVLANMDKREADQVLAAATPDPKVSWAKVTTALKIKREDIPFSQDGPSQVVFSLDGKKVNAVDLAQGGSVDIDEEYPDLIDVEFPQGVTRTWSFSEDDQDIPF